MSVTINGSTGISGVDGSAGTPALQGGDSNTGISFGTDVILASTGGSERLRIDSSGRVGIGTTSPSFLLQAQRSGAGIVSWFGNDAGSGLYLQAESGVASVNSRNSSTALAFGLDTSEKARIDTSGRLLVGQSTATANGGILQISSGITFPATQVAATDPNTLDDYEEGNWTPLPIGLSNTPNWSNQTGRYTKIGRQVFLQGILQTWSTLPTFTSTSAQFAIGGLPFTPSNNGGGYLQTSGGCQFQSFRFLGAGFNDQGITTCDTIVPGLAQVGGVWGVVFSLSADNNVRAVVLNNGQNNSDWLLEFTLTYHA